jgi:hypothetical protein
MIRSNILGANFSDEYKCKSIMKTYDYGKDNLAVIHDVIEDYDSLGEEEQHKQILLHFEHIKRFLHLTDKQLLDKVLGDKINVREYEYICKIPTYRDNTIELMIKHDIVGMTGKSDWTIDDITEIFRTRKDNIMERLYLYTNEYNIEDEKERKRSNKIFKSLYEDDEWDKEGNLKQSEALVNFINEYLASDKEHNCEVFFNDKPIVIYKSEIQKIKEISKKYRTNDKDGRRIVRLACLLLAWQKADQNQYYNRRDYAEYILERLLEYNPIVEVEGRSDSKAMIQDYKKLQDDGYFEKTLPKVPAPREIKPTMYYRMTFCVDRDNAENEEVALIITDFENLWEQIFVAAFGEFDVLEQPKEKDIKKGIIKSYDTRSKTGKVYIEDKGRDYPFSVNGRYKEGQKVKVFIIDSKKNKVQVLKKDNERVYMKYKAVKRCSSCGKMFYAKQMGNGTGNCDKCNRR